jgi:UDP-glucose 4-epimerase
MSKSRHTILVTGGAGYIGSHTVLQMKARGDTVIVLDNLSTGFGQAVGNATLVQGDVGDTALVDRLIAELGIETRSCISRPTRSCRNRSVSR